MSLPSINFDFGITRIDQLVQQMRQPAGSCQQRMQCALKGLAEVREFFERGRLDPVKISQIQFKVVTRCCAQLKSLSLLVLNPSSPYASISNPRFNDEVAINEGELLSTITMTQRTVVGNWFAALNRSIESVRTHLKSIAEKTSNRNIDLLQHYRKSNPTSDDCWQLSKQITDNFDQLSAILKALARVSEEILASMDRENIDRALFNKEDLQTFNRILYGSQTLDGYVGIYDIYHKISYSLAVAKGDIAGQLKKYFYKPSFKLKDIESIVEDEKGRPRDSFDVLQDYEEMIRGLLTDLNRLLEKDHKSPSRVLLVYSKLKEYMEARDEFLEEEAEIYGERKEALSDKIMERSLEIMRLPRMGATQREIDAARKHWKRTKEKLAECEEYYKEIQKMEEIELYEQAQELLEDVKNLDQYNPYLTKSTFEYRIAFDKSHWLLNPLVCETIAELLKVEEAFVQYAGTVKSLNRLLKRGSSQGNSLISPLEALEALISGAYIPEKPYTQLTLSMTEYQRQIYAAASMEDREAGLSILNDLWKTGAAEVDANNEMSYNEVQYDPNCDPYSDWL